MKLIEARPELQGRPFSKTAFDLEKRGQILIASTTVQGVPIYKSLFDAQTILIAILDNTPVALTVDQQSVVGRVTSGNIVALTGAQLWAILTGQAGTAISMNAKQLTSVADPTLDQDGDTKIARDAAITTHAGLPNIHQSPITQGFRLVGTKLQVESRVKKIFLPASEGFIETGTLGQIGVIGIVAVEGAANLNEPYIHNTFQVPADFDKLISVEAVWSSPAASGNMYWSFEASWARENEGSTTESPDFVVTATGGANIFNVQEPTGAELVMSGLAPFDILNLLFYRAGADALDTLNDFADFYGFIFTYLAVKDYPLRVWIPSGYHPQYNDATGEIIYVAN